jgi:hypothetical protein
VSEREILVPRSLLPVAGHPLPEQWVVTNWYSNSHINASGTINMTFLQQIMETNMLDKREMGDINRNA